MKGYDAHPSMFAPSGRIPQVEYAREVRRKEGTGRGEGGEGGRKGRDYGKENEEGGEDSSSEARLLEMGEVHVKR